MERTLSLQLEPPITAITAKDPRIFVPEPALPIASYTPGSYRAPSPVAYTTSPYSPASTLPPLPRTPTTPSNHGHQYSVSPISQSGLSPLLEGIEITVSPSKTSPRSTSEPVFFHPDDGCIGMIEDGRKGHSHHHSLVSPLEQRRSSAPVSTERLTPSPSRDSVSQHRSSHQHSLSDAARNQSSIIFPTSAESLNVLWNVSQGAPRSGDGQVFVLNMYEQPKTEQYTFGPSPLEPFYSLTSCEPQRGAKEITLTRINSTLQDYQKIATMRPPRNGLPNQDGLVNGILPQRAVTAAERELSRVSPVTRAKPAAVKAAEPELCKLVWSSRRQRYELEHPAMSSSHPDADPVLVVKIEGRVGFNNPTANGRIKLLNMTNKEVLGSLDFGRRLLFVNTGATAKVESRHAADVAIAALVSVATVEGRRFRERKAEEMKRIEEEKRVNALTPRRVVMSLINGAWTLVYFTVRLGWEIGKAIFDACRPIKRGEKY